MPRDLSAEAVALNQQNVLARFLTLEIAWPQGVTTRWAGTAMRRNNMLYQSRLISASPLQLTQGRPADHAEITVSNTDYLVTDLDAAAAVPGAYERERVATVGRILRDPHAESTDEWIWVQMFSGVVVAVSTNRKTASIQIIGDIYAAPQVGAIQTTSRICGFEYRDSDTCAYTGPLPDCNHYFEGPNGCEGHQNQYHFGGMIIDTSKETLTVPPPDNTGGTGGGDGGGGGGIDDGSGRRFDPYYQDIY